MLKCVPPWGAFFIARAFLPRIVQYLCEQAKKNDTEDDTMNELQAFEKHLRENEKSPATIEKYLRDARAFLRWLDGRKPTKELTVCYKEGLTERYEAASVNSMLAGVNSYLSFSGRADCRVKPLRVQRTLFGSEERELSREEYARLVRAAGGAQIGVVMQTICGTGIRVSELRHITAEAGREGRAAVRNKGKTRVILIPAALRRLLLGYMKKAGVTTGSVFLSKSKTPLDRSTVWRRMKALCERAGVDPRKVFPHSLRHLFARAFYSADKDISRLADILGHSSVETTRVYIVSSGLEHENPTRIYTMETGRQHMKLLERVSRVLLT